MKVFKGKCNNCGEPDKTFYGLNKICSKCQNEQKLKRGKTLTNDFLRINGKQIF